MGRQGIFWDQFLGKQICKKLLVRGFSRKLLQNSFALVFAVSLAACGGGGASNSDGEVGNNNLGGGFSIGQAQDLSFGSSTSASITFGELSGGEVFALSLQAADENEGNMSFAVSGASSSSLSLPVPDKSILASGPQLTYNVTSDFHSQLRALESGMEEFEESRVTSKMMSEQNSLCTPPSVGAQENIKIFSSLSNSNSYVTRPMEVRKVSENVVYYVDTIVPDSELSDSDLEEVAAIYDANYDAEVSAFGEWDHASECRISVFISPVVNCLGASGGGFVTGYFYGGDQYSTSLYTSSNERSAIYIASPNSDGDLYCSGVSLTTSFWKTNIGPTVIPHEIQHMINFNQRVFFHSNSSEESWFNEALSHLAEDIAGLTFTNSNLSASQSLSDDNIDLEVGMENPSRVDLYLQSINSIAFTGGTSLQQRGGSYLFARYLYEQAELGRFGSSGAAMLSSLMSNSERGIDNIESATGENFKDLLNDFCAAVYLDDTGLSSDPRYNFSGLDLRSDQDDNRFTSLDGPAIEDFSGSSFSDTVNSPGCLFVEISGSEISNLGGEITITGSSSSDPAASVIRAN